MRSPTLQRAAIITVLAFLVVMIMAVPALAQAADPFTDLLATADSVLRTVISLIVLVVAIIAVNRFVSGGVGRAITAVVGLVIGVGIVAAQGDLMRLGRWVWQAIVG